jgi:hypothetical protein
MPPTYETVYEDQSPLTNTANIVGQNNNPATTHCSLMPLR